jgi:kumamolisin
MIPSGIHTYIKRPKLPRTSGPFTVPTLCAAYNWPRNLPGGGVIAIVELGGGWVQSDIDAFFRSVGQPSPRLTDVSVDGTTNTPDPSPDSADFEVALDIEVAAAAYYVATGKVATVRVYWSQDIAQAVRKAAADGCDVCSISWGADEAVWGADAVRQMELAATVATTAGMVVFAAAGDNDASDGGDTPANVDCPACCPHVIGCGGTSKSSSAEVVWNNDPNPHDPNGEGTGGGYSTVFPKQSFQVNAPLPPPGLGRMVPDVAANADPNTGYTIFCHGSPTVIGGTSAVAPLYAGLFAAFGRKLGFVTPKIWQHAACFTDITVGGNGLYVANVGPDPCTGMGVPIGQTLAGVFAPPAPHVTLEQVETAIHAEYVAGSFFSVLLRSQAIALANRACARLLSSQTTPTLTSVESAIAAALQGRFAYLRTTAEQIVDAAIAPLFP